jgi:hypothetical protein
MCATKMAKDELDYLGYKSPTRAFKLTKKVEFICRIKAPQNRRQPRFPWYGELLPRHVGEDSHLTALPEIALLQVNTLEMGPGRTGGF